MGDGDRAARADVAGVLVTPLEARLTAMIAAHGPISVSEYFALCLSDPGHGYYMTREPFGAEGDFTTAPEISQMFGELIGVWLASAWRAAGEPEQPLLVEIGPGRGTLAKDVSRTLARIAPDLLQSARCILIETSERLRAIQAQTLGGAAARFEWATRLEDLPRQPLLIVGNEFFDAIPIRQYVKAKGVWRERVVGLSEEGRLAFAAGAGSLDPALLPVDADAAPEGAVFEIAPTRMALMQAIAEHIVKHGGVGLFIDYGAVEWGVGDTLQAVRRHQPEDVLAHPGEADLTSHVDFGALAQATRAEGLEARTTTQGAFLLGLGLLERAGRLGASADAATRQTLQNAVERLAAPEQMGDLFKVLAVGQREMMLTPFEAPNSR